MLVVVGVIALLLAITIPPLHAAHRHAMATQCMAQQREIGVALQAVFTEHGYYPVWDDGSSPTRYTWVDVLLQKRLLDNRRQAYCPMDPGPGPVNSARARQFDVVYPGAPRSGTPTNTYGIDYSYGIGAPLSAGGWNYSPAYATDGHNRRFIDHDRYTSQRLLVADASWSVVYNMSGDILNGHDWSYPTQYDNTVDWRHRGDRANILFQDGHVARLNYNTSAERPINTSQVCLWYPGEDIHVGPESEYRGHHYPNVPPVDVETGASGSIPRELVPGYYTHNLLWTRIEHK